jgi:hypothetical protein
LSKAPPARVRVRRLAALALMIALGTWVTAATPTIARAAAADSLAAPAAIHVVGEAAAPPGPARADSLRRPPWHEQPRFVMARSLLVPGWGQAHNHAWIKAVLVASAEAVLITQVVRGQSELDRLLAEIDVARADSDAVREEELVTEYNAQLDDRVASEWKLGAVIAYAMLDAYVDAHFRGFDVEFRNDPALPAGTSPTGLNGGGGGPGVRLAMRWNF